MADTAGTSPEPAARRRIFDRRGELLAGALVLVLLGVGAYQISSRDSGHTVLVESAFSIGPDPFTTSGVVLGAVPSTMLPPPDSTETTRKPGLFGGSGDPGVCDPAALVAFLNSNRDKAIAWVDALNNDPTLRWSGGSQVSVAQIGAYVAELRSTALTVDTRVTNHGFKKGKATPRQSLLKKGTAVLVDADGVPRVRCKCGNPLNPPDCPDCPPPTTTTRPKDTTTTERPIDTTRPKETTTTRPVVTTTTRVSDTTTTGPAGTPSNSAPTSQTTTAQGGQ